MRCAFRKHYRGILEASYTYNVDSKVGAVELPGCNKKKCKKPKTHDNALTGGCCSQMHPVRMSFCLLHPRVGERPVQHACG